MNEVVAGNVRGKSLLGPDSAENDPNLDDYFVNLGIHKIVKPITTGRWGVGKTASLVHRYSPLERTLKEIKNNKDFYRIWFMTEESMPEEHLVHLKSKFGDDPYKLRLVFQRLWKAEISRRLAIQVAGLYEYYGSPVGAHWRYIREVVASQKILSPVWGIIISAGKLVLNERHESLDDLDANLRSLFNDETYKNLLICFEEIPNKKLLPACVIEPIETPESPLEKASGLAQSAIDALIETYERNFITNKTFGVEVLLSIPWHRDNPNNICFPQKIGSNYRTITWASDDLKKFIDERIRFDTKKYTNTSIQHIQDPWTHIISTDMPNTYIVTRIKEATFDYVLRHTQHRTRDLQRFTRRIIEVRVENSETLDIPDVFRRRDGVIPSSIVREAVKEESIKLYGERLEESRRRYPSVDTIMNALTSLKIPFEFPDFSARFKEQTQQDIESKLEILWECGFLGIQIKPTSTRYEESLENTLGKTNRKQFQLSSRGALHSFWFFYQYNSEWSRSVLIDRFNDEDHESEAKYILHPLCFDVILPKVTKEYPVGV